MYRLLRMSDDVHERRRQARHPENVKPEYSRRHRTSVGRGTSPDCEAQIAVNGIRCFVMLDIFSRMDVGWTLVRRADATIAA